MNEEVPQQTNKAHTKGIEVQNTMENIWKEMNILPNSNVNTAMHMDAHILSPEIIEEERKKILREIQNQIEEKVEDSLIADNDIQNAKQTILFEIEQMRRFVGFEEYRASHLRAVFLQTVKEVIHLLLDGEMEHVIFDTYTHLEIQEIGERVHEKTLKAFYTGKVAGSIELKKIEILQEEIKIFFVDTLSRAYASLIEKNTPQVIIENVLQRFSDTMRKNMLVSRFNHIETNTYNPYFFIWNEMENFFQRLIRTAYARDIPGLPITTDVRVYFLKSLVQWSQQRS